jgi:Thioredoxin domain-containing protein 17-like, thioredoxin domain
MATDAGDIMGAGEEFDVDSSLVEVEIVKSPADFDAAVDKWCHEGLRASSSGSGEPGKVQLFAHFVGALAPPGHSMHGKGVSWCEDCTKADPIVAKGLEKLGKGLQASSCRVVVLRCLVERSLYSGNPQYAYRTHGKIHLQSVPSLLHWGRVRVCEFVSRVCPVFFGARSSPPLA